MKKLIDIVLNRKIKTVTMIGLAKNAGKTVTFNTLVKEAVENKLRLALLSYGRDGEETDILNRHQKPRIFIPPDTIFVTTDQALSKSLLLAEKLFDTGINTTLGKVNIYLSKNCEKVELTGVNSTNQLKKIREIIGGKFDLLLTDGALDRRSSAIPVPDAGIILSTGAVIGNTEELVVKRTFNEIFKLTLPKLQNNYLKEILNSNNKGGILDTENNFTPFEGNTVFEIINKLQTTFKEGNLILINGALTDSFIEELCFSLNAGNIQIVVNTPTQVFLNNRSINLAKKHKISLFTLNKIKLLAITVNPVSPYGIKLFSGKLIDQLKEKLPDIPVYDLMQDDYGI